MKITKHRLQITNWFLIFGFFLVSVGSASAWLPGDPMVFCGSGGGGVCDFSSGTGECFGGSNAGNFCSDDVDCGAQVACTKCDLLKLVKNLIDFLMIALAPVLATVLFVVAGVYLMLGGTNPGMLAQGKRIFKDTFIGLLIIMLAWLITNTLIVSLTGSSSWWTISCSQLGL